MAIRPLNSVAGFSVGETPSNIILANGDVTTTNITTTGVSNLNSVGNVKISGGSSGQVISTDGSGNLSFITIGTASLNNGTSNVTVLNSGNITFSVAGSANIGTFTSTGLNVNGYITSTGTVTAANANLGNTVTANFFTGTVTTSAQPNITSIGTLTTLNVNSTVNAVAFSSNVATGTAPLTVLSNTVVANLNADLLDGFNTATANTANTVAVRDASGNLAANFFIGNGSQLTGLPSGTSIANGNSNVSAGTANGNITVSVAGNANVVTFTGTGANVDGYANVTGNVTAGNVYANAGIIAAQTLKGEGGNISNIQGANVSGTVSSASTAGTAGTVTTNAQPNITSVGTLSSLAVTGNLSSGNANLGNAATANFFIGSGNNLSNIQGANVSGAVAFATTANAVAGANVSGQVGNALVAGTVYTNAQPNITSVGTLTSLTVTGTATAGNLSTGGTLSVTGNANVGNLGTGGLITATGNVSGGNLTTGGVVAATGNIVSNANVVTDLIVGRTSSVTITATGTNQNVNLVPTGTGSVNVGNFIISNVATPVASTDAATKQYVDDIAQGLQTHDSCNAATSTTLATSSGGTVTYNNGTSGVGATLTTTGSYTTIDGVTLSNGMRILVKNEANAAHNGIYDRTSTTVLTRSSDFDTPTEMAGGDFTFVTAGTLYDNTGWVMTDPVTTVGTTAVNWVQFSGAGAYTAGTGLTLTGTQFSITNTTVSAGSYGNGDSVATFTVNAQGQLTAAANVAITANAANLTGSTLNSSIVTSSLTSVGTLGALAVTANVTAGNVYANTGTIGALTLKGEGGNISNIQGANVSGAVSFATTANAVAGANVSGQVGNALVAGTVYTNAQPNITSVGTLTSLAVTGNVTTGNISGTNGNLTTANVSGNIILGNATVTTQITWSSLTTTSTAANQTIASISTTGVTGVEYLIKAIDSTGSKYSVASVIAVTDGTSVDYSTYGTVQLGGYTGSLVVNIVGGQVRLQVTPASSNSTVWTTQYRLI